MPNNSLADFPYSNDPEILIKYIEQHPKYQELVECAKQGKPLPKELKIWHRKAIDNLLSVVRCKPEDYYGKAYVTEVIKVEAKKTAGINTAANWIDGVSNLPLYVFSFKSLGLWGSFGAGLVLDVLVLWCCNLMAAKAVSTKPDYFKNGGKGKLCSSAKGAIFGLIFLNVIKSVVSGVGVELLNNQSELNRQKADQVADVYLDKLKNTPTGLDNHQYIKAVSQCQSGQQDLKALQPGDPRWDSTYVNIYGAYADRNLDRSSVPTQQLPLCLQAKRLEQESSKKYQEAQKQFNFLSFKRADAGNDLVFLKQNLRNIYYQNFIDKGDVSTAEIANGVEAVSIATENFFGKLSRGQFSQLGFSIFFFSLSMITSAVSVIVTITHARRDDILMSRNESIARERHLWLETRWNQLQERALSVNKQDSDF
ncbi:MAG: hypothetical protein N5P05_003528 [Chroococcopsis gigantea SAG 12.99]|nr:hypothetical protein [Chlorogloea purpurea SAG 13.99]MDV3001922.1 hypothetical protein [Chroococcopsis gigantea SAG 12.99]